ncbi:alpha/beta fold hydrolase [Noviherbaspirillum pedocola]|uniref:Alpha/beta hydrolase n=1 Tax=Noviherbaspirillum pedocola TaxID=2801341 RepID=A0A934T130_9BURK|nr:alpha/beta fold hydrolase [Noviherbaspirillum pedocola]MBK4735488.1 alpha/beta hydrolase [Noviherbaspirillum pedocola]
MPDTRDTNNENTSLEAAASFNYLISARNLISDTEFGEDIGDVTYLKVPKGEIATPQYQIDRQDWVLEVRDIADSIADHSLGPTGDVLVFVHGYNNSPETIRDRHEVLQEYLAVEGWGGIVVSYDWPCGDDTLNYFGDRSKAALTAHYLVDNGIRLIVEGQTKYGCETNIHLLGHSTGAYVIMDAFAAAKKVGSFYDKPWRVAQVAFIGGDVAANSLDADSDWGTPMFERIMRLTNYSNGFDDVLAISNAKRLGTVPRAGRVGLTENANPKAVNVDCSSYFQHLDPASQTVKLGWWNHTWFLGNHNWTRDLAMTLEGRYDRRVLPTREEVNGRLVLTEGTRPRFESEWRRLVNPVAAELRPGSSNRQAIV